QLDRRLGQVQATDVEQGDAELRGVGGSDLAGGDQPVVHQVGLDRLLLLDRFVHGLAGIWLRKNAVQYQSPDNAGDADQIGSSCGTHPESPQTPSSHGNFTAKTSSPAATLFSEFHILSPRWDPSRPLSGPGSMECGPYPPQAAIPRPS